MAQEEKAAATACTFASFEDLISIEFRTETSLNDLVVVKVLFEGH